MIIGDTDFLATQNFCNTNLYQYNKIKQDRTMRETYQMRNHIDDIRGNSMCMMEEDFKRMCYYVIYEQTKIIKENQEQTLEYWLKYNKNREKV